MGLGACQGEVGSRARGGMPAPSLCGWLQSKWTELDPSCLSPQPEGWVLCCQVTACIPVSLEPASRVAEVTQQEEDHETCGMAMEHQL